jgi:hypothetical protein
MCLTCLMQCVILNLAKGLTMIITAKLTETQIKQVHNLILNCDNKQDMFDHLIAIGLNAFHAILMSNSYERQKASYTLMALIPDIKPREYHWNEFEKRMIYLLD